MQKDRNNIFVRIWIAFRSLRRITGFDVWALRALGLSAAIGGVYLFFGVIDMYHAARTAEELKIDVSELRKDIGDLKTDNGKLSGVPGKLDAILAAQGKHDTAIALMNSNLGKLESIPDQTELSNERIDKVEEAIKSSSHNVAEAIRMVNEKIADIGKTNQRRYLTLAVKLRPYNKNDGIKPAPKADIFVGELPYSINPLGFVRAVAISPAIPAPYIANAIILDTGYLVQVNIISETKIDGDHFAELQFVE